MRDWLRRAELRTTNTFRPPFRSNAMHELALATAAFCTMAAVVHAAPIVGALPRSDARTLHADFENFTDGVFAPLNAGVATVGMQEVMKSPLREGRATVLDDFPFEGSRCLAIRNTTGKTRVRAIVQKLSVLYFFAKSVQVKLSSRRPAENVYIDAFGIRVVREPAVLGR